MIRSLAQLLGLELEARDGPAGEVRDFYLDDRHWTVRYVVVRSRGTDHPHDVLVELEAVGWLPDDGSRLPVGLSKAQVAESSDARTAKPVSAQLRTGPTRTWRSPPLQSAAALSAPLSPGLQPGAAPAVEAGKQEMFAPGDPQEDRRDDPHLRSFRELSGYGFRTKDAVGGCLEDMLIEDRTWTVRFLVLKLRGRRSNDTVCARPVWVGRIDVGTGTVHLARRLGDLGGTR